MRTITVSNDVFEAISQRAIPYVDKEPNDTLRRILAASNGHTEHAEAARIADRVLDPMRPDDLSHTKIMSGSFDGHPVTNWNHLLHEANRFARRRCQSYAEYRQITHSNVEEGVKTENGYHPLRDVNISVQNRSANQAWPEVLHIARKFGVPVEVSFQWRENDKAAFPGEEGRMSWQP